MNVRFYWDVPFTCCNTTDSSAPSGCTNAVTKGLQGGEHPDATFTVSCVSSAGDGIADVWKLNGASFDDGTGTNTKAFVDLPRMGANVSRKQIFLQIDWLQDGTCNQSISAAAIKNIGDAFAAHNIDLIVDEGPGSTNRVTGQAWGSLSRANQLPCQKTISTISGGKWAGAGFQNIRDGTGGVTCPNVCFQKTGRRAIFHYVISGVDYAEAPGSSGFSPSGGNPNDVMVSLGTGWPDGNGIVNDQSGTLMHELGHNLGLQHGGSTEAINFKPNYLSVMNYGFTTTGIQKSDGTTTFDYSETALPALVESGLNESNGIGAAAAGLTTKHWCPASTNPLATLLGIATVGSYVTVADGSKPIAWGCEGVPTPGKIVSADVNGDSVCVNPGSDGILETKAAGDDVVNGLQILMGPDLKCDTTAPSGDDSGPQSWITQYLPVGSVEPLTLNGASDWDKLQLKNGSIGGNGTSPSGGSLPVSVPDDLTAQEARTILPLDTTPPVTTESESATPPRNAAGWYRTDVTVTLTATDDISGVALTQYNLDNAGWTTYTAPFVISTEAVHTLQYRSVDASQNQEMAKSATIRIDKTPPVISIGGVTDGQAIPAGVSPTIGVTDALSGVDPSMTVITLDGNPYSAAACAMLA